MKSGFLNNLIPHFYLFLLKNLLCKYLRFGPSKTYLIYIDKKLSLESFSIYLFLHSGLFSSILNINPGVPLYD